MNRIALLIEASQVSGLVDLPGARKDVEDLKFFLKSPLGGAWDENEIKILRTPTKSLLEINLSSAKSYNYVFIAFSGHGYHAKGKNINETRICLYGSQEISVNTLNCGSPKTTIVIDACREVHVIKEDITATFAMDELSKRMLYADRAAHRKLFDDAITSAPMGAEYLYSCNLDEAAGESSEGGYFTQALLRSGKNFNKKACVLTVDDAFREGKYYVTAKAPQQHPVFEGGRRLTHFPFAVCT
jgi:hypothetical protein